MINWNAITVNSRQNKSNKDVSVIYNDGTTTKSPAYSVGFGVSVHKYFKDYEHVYIGVAEVGSDINVYVTTNKVQGEPFKLSKNNKGTSFGVFSCDLSKTLLRLAGEYNPKGYVKASFDLKNVGDSVYKFSNPQIVTRK